MPFFMKKKFFLIIKYLKKMPFFIKNFFLIIKHKKIGILLKKNFKKLNL